MAARDVEGDQEGKGDGDEKGEDEGEEGDGAGNEEGTRDHDCDGQVELDMTRMMAGAGQDLYCIFDGASTQCQWCKCGVKRRGQLVSSTPRDHINRRLAVSFSESLVSVVTPQPREGRYGQSDTCDGNSCFEL